MIQYSLKCENGHTFDSWFQSAGAFETLQKAGHVECIHCGSTKVDKAIMAPRVTTARKKADAPQLPAPAPAPETAPMAMQADPKVQEYLQKMKQHVEANSDYVGDSFASEARAMHLGDAPERSIYGEASLQESKALVEDGVPVLPLPFRPTRKSN